MMKIKLCHISRMRIINQCYERNFNYCVCLSFQGYSTGYPYKNPDLYISEKSPKTPEAQIPPTISTLTDKKPLTMYYEIERGGPITRTTTSFGRANTYKNRIKWLNSPAPVLATQYKKEKPVSKVVTSCFQMFVFINFELNIKQSPVLYR